MGEDGSAERNFAGKEGGLRVKPCLSETSLLPLPGKAEQRDAGDVDAIGLIPIYGNRSIQPGHRELGKGRNRRQRKVLRKKAKLIVNEDRVDAAPPSGAICKSDASKRNFGKR